MLETGGLLDSICGKRNVVNILHHQPEIVNVCVFPQMLPELERVASIFCFDIIHTTYLGTLKSLLSKSRIVRFQLCVSLSNAVLSLITLRSQLDKCSHTTESLVTLKNINIKG